MNIKICRGTEKNLARVAEFIKQTRPEEFRDSKISRIYAMLDDYKLVFFATDAEEKIVGVVFYGVFNQRVCARLLATDTEIAQRLVEKLVNNVVDKFYVRCYSNDTVEQVVWNQYGIAVETLYEVNKRENDSTRISRVE